MKELTPFARYILTLLALAILLIQACSPAETKDCGGACADNEECINNQFCLPKCETSQSRCGTECKDLKIDTKHCGKCDNACKDGQACKDGKCDTGPACKDGETDCNGQCVDTTSDAKHCGKCGIKCPAGEACQSGTCAFSCPSEQKNCGGACVNTKANREHCGACDNKCESGQVCNQGKCELNCPKDLTVCNGGCIDTQKDASHCGSCDTACRSNELCQFGLCEAICPNNFTMCADTCTNTQSDTSHCGACDNKCKAGEACITGICKLVCAPGLTKCNERCINTNSDSKNCGTCGEVCKDRTVCQSGKCTVFCHKGYTDCSGSCADVNVDPTNCGACGNKCAATEHCNKGVCRANCVAGRNYCGNICTDLTNDRENCGTCGNKCTTGQACNNGKCEDCFNCPFQTVRAGAVGAETVQDMAMDSNGNTYLTGSFHLLATFGKWTIRTPQQGGYIAKMDPRGNWLWAVGWSWTGGASRGIALDSQGRISVIGDFAGTATIGGTKATSKGSSDIFIARWDKDGKWLWTKTYGGPSYDNARALAIDSKDNVYATGSFHVIATFGTKTIASRGETDVVVLKWNSSGMLIDAKQYGGRGDDAGHALAIDGNDNIYISGNFSHTVNFATTTLTSTNDKAGFILKVNATGKETLAIKHGGQGSLTPQDIHIGANGNITLTGYFSGFFTVGSNTYEANGIDGFVSQWDSTGKRLWTSVLKGNMNQYPRRLALDSQQRVFVVGEFDSDITVGSKTTKSLGANDGFVAQLSQAGAFEGTATVAGTDTDQLHAIAIDAQDNIHVAGWFTGLGKLGSIQRLSRGASDIFVATYAKPKVLCDNPANVCGNACVDFQSDVKHCGTCGTTCRTGELCTAGKCACPQGETFCGGRCINTTNNTQNCGGCGTTCKTQELCLAGVCGACTDCVSWLAQGADSTNGYADTQGIAIDSKGNTYVIGHVVNKIRLGNIPLQSLGAADILVAKIDPKGTWVWAKRYGSGQTHRAIALAVDANANVYFAASIRSGFVFGNQVLPTYGRNDAIIAKLDKDGNEQWIRRVVGSANDYPEDIATDNAGNVYITGWFQKEATFGTTKLNSLGDENAFVSKIDSTGQWKWTKQLKSNQKVYGRGIALDQAGNIYVTGLYLETFTLGTKTLRAPASSSFRSFIAKLDPTGQALWAISDQSTIPQSQTFVESITIDNAGSAYITGRLFGTSTFGNTTITSKGNADIIIAKVSNKGLWEWAKSFGTKGDDYGYRIVAAPNGNIFLSGAMDVSSSAYNIGTTTQQHPSRDCVLSKWDNKGKVLGVAVSGGAKNEYCYALAVDSQGLPHLGGSATSANLIFGPTSFKRLTVSKFGTAFVAKMHSTDLCSAPNTMCNGTCTNTQIDPKNCGTCGTSCSGTRTCQTGTCQ